MSLTQLVGYAVLRNPGVGKETNAVQKEKQEK